MSEGNVMMPTPGTIVGSDRETWYELEYSMNDDDWYSSKETADTLPSIREKLRTSIKYSPSDSHWRIVRKIMVMEILA